MITWYNDDNIAIYFNDIPHPCVRIVIPSMTQEEKEDINRLPFINKKELEVKLVNKNKVYNFTIAKGYKWDGATIPRLFWRLIGAKTDPKFLVPSLIHDVLCENKSFIDNDRYFADKVFERLLYVSGVSAFNRWLMFHSVDNFQKLCNWNKTKNRLITYIESEN